MSKAIELLEKMDKEKMIEADPVKKPSHYTWNPLFECKELTQYIPFNEGNVVKYLYRCGFKGDAEQMVQDKKKALQYIRMMEDTPANLQRDIYSSLESFFVVIANRYNASQSEEYYLACHDYTLILKCAEYFNDDDIRQAFIEVMNTLTQHNLHDRTTLYDRVSGILNIS